MNLKTFKTDLTYFCKKAQKDGLTLSVDQDNLSIGADGKFLLEGKEVHPLEYFILGKGYLPTGDIITRNHQGYNMLLSDFVSLQTEILVEDLYQFSTALENFEGDVKNEYYTLGVYIREKFTPVGANPTLVKNNTFQPAKASLPSFRKFVLHNYKKITYIREVECQLYTEYKSWTSPNEWAATIISPVEMYELDKKTNQMVPPVWVSLAFFDSIEEVRTRIFWNSIYGIRKSKYQTLRKAEVEDIKEEMIAATEEEVQAALDQVQVSML
jgi:hypothetical protein